MSQGIKDAPPHLKTLEEIEKTGIPGLVEVLREEGIDAVRYALWDATGWHRDYSPPTWRNKATKEQKIDRLGDGGEDREDRLHGAG